MMRMQSNDMTEQIWRELNQRLRQFVRSRVDSESDVDDILQTVFLRIHTQLGTLRDADRLESWVFQIARNAVVDHYRAHRPTESEVDSIIEPRKDDDVAGELAGCLSAMIQRLPQDQRRAVSLYELEGISQKEIAAHESISLSGAKSRIQRGRKSLETMMKACCEFQFDVRGKVIDYGAADSDCCEGTCAVRSTEL